MSLINSNLISTVKKQSLFKLQGCLSFFLVMIIAQSIGIIFTMNNGGGSSATDGVYSFNIFEISTVQVFVFTIACAIGTAIALNLSGNKNMDFTFVSNRLSSNLSNIAFLAVYILFGAFTYALSEVFIRAMKYLSVGSKNILEQGFFIAPGELLCSFAAAFAYVLLFTCLAHFSTVLVQKSNLFILVLLAVLVILPKTISFNDIIKFYGEEHSLILLMLKAIVTSVIFLTASIFISNDAEVR